MPITTVPAPAQLKNYKKAISRRTVFNNLNTTGNAPATPVPTTGQTFPRGTKNGT